MFKITNQVVVSGQEMFVGDEAYNKDKREQVENPCEIVVFIKDMFDNTYAILKPPHTDEFLQEDVRNIELYPGNILYEGVQ